MTKVKSKLSASCEFLESRTLLSGTAKQVMGYLPDYEIADSNPVFYENPNTTTPTGNLDWKGLTQVNYFALLPNANGTLQASTNSGFNPAAQLPKLVADAKSHGVSVFVTVGGGDLGKSIPAMNALINSNQAAWATFAGQLKTFCTTYGLAGVDLDWEPISTTKSAIENYGTLIATIKADDPSLKLTAAVLGNLDATTITDVPIGNYVLDAKAVANLDAVNVEAYIESPAAAKTSMQGWVNYFNGTNRAADVTGAAVKGAIGKLQFGLDVDAQTQAGTGVESDVDTTVSKSYGGLFLWTLPEDTASRSIISRVSTELTKGTPLTTGSVNGTITAGGKGLANVTVYLDENSNSKLDTGELHTTTSTTGAYSFSNVPVEVYVVRQVLPTGDTQTSPASSVGHAISVTAGSSLTGENFTDTAPATVSGSILTTSGAGVAGVAVYLDANNNSKRDTSELHTTTTSTGAYTFSNVPVHSYVVRQILLTGDSQSSPASNAGHSISVTAGAKITGENFVDIVPTGSISGSVKTTAAAALSGVEIYLDANNNSKLDTGELHVLSTSTGTFTFTNVPIGAYTIRQVVPAGRTQTSPAASAGHAITLTKGAKLVNENFTDSATVTAHKLTGTIISASVSASSSLSKAFDGNLSTDYHSSSASGNWIGLDLGAVHKLTQIKFAAASADPWNMEGGTFQASNTANFASGVVNLYTVPNSSAPSSTTLKSINISGSYRYVRFVAPGGSYDDVGEIQFYGI